MALLGSRSGLGQLLDDAAANTAGDLFRTPHGEEDGRWDDEPGSFLDLSDHPGNPMCRNAGALILRTASKLRAVETASAQAGTKHRPATVLMRGSRRMPKKGNAGRSSPMSEPFLGLEGMGGDREGRVHGHDDDQEQDDDCQEWQYHDGPGFALGLAMVVAKQLPEPFGEMVHGIVLVVVGASLSLFIPVGNGDVNLLLI